MTTVSRPIPRAFGAVGNVLRWRPLAAFLFTLALLLMALGAVSTAYAALHGSAALPGVSVAGVPVGDLDRPSAEARLRAVLPTLDSGNLTVRVGNSAVSTSYADLGRDYAMTTMLERAFSIGRGGSFVQNAGEQVRVLAAGIDVPPLVAWDQARLSAFVTGFLEQASSQATSANVYRDPSGAYTVAPAHEGVVIDAAALHAAVVAAVGRPEGTDTTVVAQSRMIAPTVPTSAAQGAVDRFNAATGNPITAAGGGVSANLGSSLLRGWLSLEPSTSGTGWDLVVDRGAIGGYFASFGAQIDHQPADATLEMTSDGLSAVPGVVGQAFSLPETVERISQLLLARAAGSGGSSVELAVTTTNPSFTTEQATALASQVQMVSSWTTRFIPGISNFNGENIRVPAKILNGTIVEPGERFSFLGAVGEISPENGFGLGGAIIRGHTRPQGAMGGGICSASTTMFNAALRYGYQIDARTQHAYYIDRYPVGLDATVFRSASQTVDMAFTNDSQYPLWIRGIARHAKVTFQIWTIPDGRTVKIGRPDISNRRPSEDTTVVVDTMKPGSSKRVEYPVDGFDASVTRVVYDASGAVLHTDTFNSHYIVVTGITQVGPTPEPAPSEPPPTEPPPTEPPPAP